MSRTRDCAELITHDKPGIEEQIAAFTGERITTFEALGEDRDRDSEAGAGLDVQTSREGPESRTGSAREAEKTPEPKTADRNLGL